MESKKLESLIKIQVATLYRMEIKNEDMYNRMIKMGVDIEGVNCIIHKKMEERANRRDKMRELKEKKQLYDNCSLKKHVNAKPFMSMYNVDFDMLEKEWVKRNWYILE